MKTLFEEKDLAMFALLLRISMASLWLATGILKTQNGIDGSITYYLSLFEKSMLPIFLVKIHASLIMFVELGLAVWLISGFKIKKAWIASALVLVTLAFGMIFTYKFDVASDNYLYVLISGIGLLFSKYDRFVFGSKNSESAPSE